MFKEAICRINGSEGEQNKNKNKVNTNKETKKTKGATLARGGSRYGICHVRRDPVLPVRGMCRDTYLLLRFRGFVPDLKGVLQKRDSSPKDSELHPDRFGVRRVYSSLQYGGTTIRKNQPVTRHNQTRWISGEETTAKVASGPRRRV